MTAIIDYDTGNLRSVAEALRRAGAEFTVTADAETLLRAERVILPEVRVVFDTEDMHTAEVPGYDGQMNNIVDVRLNVDVSAASSAESMIPSNPVGSRRSTIVG